MHMYSFSFGSALVTFPVAVTKSDLSDQKNLRRKCVFWLTVEGPHRGREGLPVDHEAASWSGRVSSQGQRGGQGHLAGFFLFLLLIQVPIHRLWDDTVHILSSSFSLVNPF